MRISLVIVLVLLITTVCCAHTFVLTSGKKIEGTIVKEDGTSVQIQGKDGVVLTLKKEAIDLARTLKANETQARAETSPTTHTGKKPEKKIYTNEDLKDLPEISIMGSSQTQPISEDVEPMQPGDEKKENVWRAHAERLRQKKVVAEEYCKRRYRTTQRQNAAEPEYDPNCPAIVEVDKQMDELRERARKSGVPGSWIEAIE